MGTARNMNTVAKLAEMASKLCRGHPVNRRTGGVAG
jgi:hypothetical protein